MPTSIRAAEKWHEMRFDGVTSRKQALKMVVDRLRAAKPGEWIVALGGWSEEQFTDDPRGFPLAELDQIAPNNPVALQAIYQHTYLNTAALRAARHRRDNDRIPRTAGASRRTRQASPPGIVRGAGGVAFVAAKDAKVAEGAVAGQTRAKLVAISIPWA